MIDCERTGAIWHAWTIHRGRRVVAAGSTREGAIAALRAGLK